MLSEIIAAFALLAICVAIHAGGLGILLQWQRIREQNCRGAPSICWMLIKLASGLVILHLIQIAVWAFYFFWQGCLPDLRTALYFSGTTYATVGYGDVVLPHGWRLLGPMEGLTGILMCGLSTGVFFVVVSRFLQSRQSMNGDGNRRS
jgi:hypothetical protein